jgi:hypothetical protein
MGDCELYTGKNMAGGGHSLGLCEVADSEFAYRNWVKPRKSKSG